MKNKRGANLLLINPPVTEFSFGNAGIAYLRSFLAENRIKSEYVNLNKEIFLDFEKQNALKKYFIEKVKVSDNFFSKSNKLESESLFSLCDKLLSFSGNNSLYKVFDDSDIIEKIFDISLIKGKEYIGISVSYQYQLIVSLLLANFIKKKFPDKKVILGGSLTMQRELLIDFIKRSPYNLGIDYLVVGEGENALLQLMKENPLSEIPNLVYWDGGEILFSNNFGFKEEFEKIPAPFYNSKETPQLQSSRTCYYNRCLFCAYKKFPPNNSIKSSSQIFSEIKTLKKRFDNQENAYPIYFADSCLSIDFLENFSRLVISDNVDISLTSYLRFEENLDYNVLKLAREAGFGTGAGVIRFGLETSSERLLEVVNKGTVLKNAERIIDDCYKLGINIIVSFLLNLPTQTYDEFLQDLSYIDYLLSNYDNIHVRVNMFCLENYSYFLLNKDKYGIIMIDNNYDFKYSFDYRYEGKNVIKTRSEAINIFLKFYYNLDIKKRVKISLNS